MDNRTSEFPPPWQEPPVFNLPFVSSPRIPTLPLAHAVTIHGIDGSTEPQLFESHIPRFVGKITFRYKPIHIVGEEASEETISEVANDLLAKILGMTWYSSSSDPIMFFAYDFGGIIVKQVAYSPLYVAVCVKTNPKKALTLASTNKLYRGILDRTCMVVFYGTPHQSADSETWDVNALRILHLCVKGLLGPWVPSFITKFSKYQQSLNVQFGRLGSQFHILNVCQDSVSSTGYDLVTNPSCAVVGRRGEESILLRRSHYQLASTLGYKQQTSMEGRILDAIICHWEFYQQFIATLRSNLQDVHHPPTSTHIDNRIIQFLQSDPVTQTLTKASTSTTHRIVLGKHLSFAAFSQSFAQHIRLATGDILLQLREDYPYGLPLAPHQLCASLCLQILEKQPSLILWVRRLCANLRDAALGTDTHWKLRIITRCLRALLLAPKSGVTYCLIHNPENSREDVISRVLDAVVQSETVLHLLVSTESQETDMVPSSRNHWPCIDLPRVFEAAGNSRPLQNARQRQCINSGMKWVVRAVAWISFAIRPLTIIETQQALNIICCEEHPFLVGMRNGEALLNALEFTLCGILNITESVVWISRKIASDIGRIWAKYLPEVPNPELYIANICLSHAAAELAIVSSSTSVEHPENKTERYLGSGDDESISVNAVKNQGFQSSHSQTISKYAMRYWFEHYRRATADLVDPNEALRTAMGAHPKFDQDVWIQHLVSSFWSPEVGQELRTNVQPRTIEKNYGVTAFVACDISLRMAILPFSPEDCFEWLLLTVAGEILPEGTYFDFVLKVVKTFSENHLVLTIQRLIAASRAHMTDRLIEHFDNLDLLQGNSVGLLMNCIAVGNTNSVTKFLEMAPKLQVSRKPEDHYTSDLGTALQVACEYGDSDVVNQILSHRVDTSVLDCEASYPWNALHIACYHGYKYLVEKFIEKGQDARTLTTNSPPNHCPFLITSARGLYAMTEVLGGATGFISSVENPFSTSPIQLASRYRFSKTLRNLLDHQAFKVMVKNRDENAVSLAIRSGSYQVFSQILEVFQKEAAGIRQEIKYTTKTLMHDKSGKDIASPTTKSSISYTYPPDAEEILPKAIRAATDYGSGPNVISDLLRESAPSVVTDWNGRTPLMIAARNGFFRLFIEHFHLRQGIRAIDKYGHNALDYACYYGHEEIIDYFSKRDPSALRARDSCVMTPITLAAKGGHHSIVRQLLSLLSHEERKAEFRLAAKSGQEQALKQILKFVTSVDPQMRNEYVNSKDDAGNTALHHATTLKTPRVLQFLLLQGADINMKNNSSNTPLNMAGCVSSSASLKLLLDAGGSPNIINTRGTDLLVEAVFHKRERVLQLLLEYGASTYFMDSWPPCEIILDLILSQSSPAMLKILSKHFDRIIKLARCGPLPKGIMRPTEVLCITINRCSDILLEALLEVWPDSDPVIWANPIPFGSIFQYTARYGSSSMLEFIWNRTKFRTDVNEIVGYFGTAIQAAITGKIYKEYKEYKPDKLDKLEMLLSWGARVAPNSRDPLHGYWGTALHAAAYYGDVDIVRFLLEQDGVSKDQHDLMGRLPLHLAALSEADSWEALQELLSENSTISSPDSQGRNALHIACSASNIGLVQKMLEGDGLSLINSQDIDGWTPLHWACRVYNPELVQLLISKGANAKIESKNQGWLPYQVAIYYGLPVPDEIAVGDTGDGDLQGMLHLHEL
ncbi:ankyrin repeat-containing domain protein [Nemania abortiva]|nr:ankyrin repeat-containing domain protein [Nemania abortiva]